MNEFVAAAEAVIAQREAHGWAGQGARSTLAQGPDDPRAFLVQLLIQGQQESAAHADTEPPQAWVAAFEQGLKVAWSGLTPEERLGTGLAPRWAALLGSARRFDLIDGLIDEFEAWLDTPAGAALANSLLRQSRRQKHAPLALRMLTLLHAGYRPGRPWAQEFAQVLGFVSRQDLALQTLQLLHRVGETPLSVLKRPKLDAEVRALLVRNLVPLARATMHLEAMRWLCRYLVTEGVTSDQLPSLVAMLGTLLHFNPFQGLGKWVERVAQDHPEEPSVQFLRARWGHLQGTATAQDLMAVFDPLLTRERGLDHATRWMAATLFHQGAEATALTWYREAASRAELPPRHAARLSQLAAKLEPGTQTDPAEQDGAAGLAFWTTAQWAEALRPVCGLLAGADDEGVPPGPAEDALAELRASADAAATQAENALDALQEMGIDSALEVVRGLVAHADSRLRRGVAMMELDAAAIGPAYGTTDPRRHQALLKLAYRTAFCVGEAALQRLPLQSPGIPLRSALDLAVLTVEHGLLLGEVPRALQLVHLLRERLGPLASEIIARLEESCRLEEGDLGAAAEAGRRAGRDATAQTLPLLPWPEWRAAAGHGVQTLFEEAAGEGRLEWVGEGGLVQQQVRQLPACRLEMARLDDVLVRNSVACFNASGALLTPFSWGLASGDFPPRMPGLLNRGRRGVSFESPPDAERVEQPVVVLAEMDAILHRHPYNWNVRVLPRIEAARAAGHLAGRSLLVPSELSSWMRESLSALGLTGQILPYGRQQVLRLTDAWVIQPMGRLPAGLAASLGDRLVQAARQRGKGASDGRGRFLYVSRQAAANRALVGEDAAIRLAQSMGFEIVEPEQLGALDQVALFASAHGVAGAFGAGLTQILYAPRGIRVLALSRAEERPALYADLALARGQTWRWLVGPSDTRFAALGSSRMPYQVDMTLLERELAWVREGAPA